MRNIWHYIVVEYFDCKNNLHFSGRTWPHLFFGDNFGISRRFQLDPDGSSAATNDVVVVVVVVGLGFLLSYFQIPKTFPFLN